MNRRQILKNSLIAAGAMIGSKALANNSVCKKLLTPTQPEGPFYPITPHVDTDSDLITVAGKNKIAEGKIIIVEGYVSDQNCNTTAGVLVEIWQACASGKYDHPSDPNNAPLDPNFQYWGKAVTNADGFYRFRTIVPGAYPADVDWIRPPHIHFKLSKKGYMELITQMYFAGEQYNNSDKILRKLKPSEQKQVIIPLEKISDSDFPVARFDIQIEKI